MQRSSIIATVIAAGGVLIAGSVASVAVINAASSSQPTSETIAMVSTESASAQPIVTPVVDSAPAMTLAPTALPSIDAAALPAIPEVSDQPVAAPQADTQQANTQQQAPAAASTPKATHKPKPARSASAEAAANSVSSDEARSVVMKQGDGASVVDISQADRAGYSTWAVKIARSNGEVITGYVDRESGVVVDWVVNQKAPAAPSTTAPTSSSHESDDHESDDHESGQDD
ncbi:MAG: hypothetical protein NTX29_05030 [Actinobacteria bacterium]|nr:hypothetical protein [Actinomycetota bacterium]